MQRKHHPITTHQIICKKSNQKQWKDFLIMSNWETHYHFKLDSQKVDQYIGGKWLILGTKHHKDNQLQSP